MNPAGRRYLGGIAGVEQDAGVELLSASLAGSKPVLVVTVVDGLVPVEDQLPEGAPLSRGYIDPEEMAALLVEHGYARGLGERT